MRSGNFLQSEWVGATGVAPGIALRIQIDDESAVTPPLDDLLDCHVVADNHRAFLHDTLRFLLHFGCGGTCHLEPERRMAIILPAPTALVKICHGLNVEALRLQEEFVGSGS